MRKRNRDVEAGSRPVECFYCPKGAKKVPFNTLKRHTESHHGPPDQFPPRTKDATPLSAFFAAKAKKKKLCKGLTSAEEHNDTGDATVKNVSEATDSERPSWFTSLMNILNTLTSLLNPFRNAASSLEKSASRIEKMLQERNQTDADIRSSY